MASNSPIIGSIIERKPGSAFNSTRKPQQSTGKTGFPVVQHRSQSAFARSREQARKSASTPQTKTVPEVKSSATIPPVAAQEVSSSWRDQISRENEAKVASMSEAEIEEERRQILERFGANIGDVLKRAKIAREKLKEKGTQIVDATNVDSKDAPVPVILEERKPVERARSPPPPAIVTPATTRPSSRADRRLRFADLEPQDVYVYDSAHASPEKRVMALPPPRPEDEGTTTSIGTFKSAKGKLAAIPAAEGKVSTKPTIPKGKPQPELVTPELIRRRYFPNAPKDDPNLAWTTDLPANPDTVTNSVRFDLHGNPIPPSVSATLPTHLGLHHHAEGAHAGYTLDDIFLLSRSTVPAQRATMLGVLARIAHKLGNSLDVKPSGLEEFSGREEELRKRILAAGIEAMTERGGVGTAAIEAIWECVVGWDTRLAGVTSVEIGSTANSTINSLPFDHLLPEIANIIRQGDLPPESMSQLLGILYRFAQQSIALTSAIANTPRMLDTVVQSFLLSPVSPHEGPIPPSPFALDFLSLLASSSREIAKEVGDMADSFLRFVSFLPSASPFAPDLTVSLITCTLHFYKILASYGFATKIPGMAVTQFTQLEQYVISDECQSQALKIVWAELVEVWTICAIDPHQTTPPHEIRWSQISSWSWNSGLQDLQLYSETDERTWKMWTASWNALAAWLEGSKVNGVRGGDEERFSFLDCNKDDFEAQDGRFRLLVNALMDKLEVGLGGLDADKSNAFESFSSQAALLSALIRVWLACIPPHTEGPPSSPPFTLPLPRISAFLSRLISHPFWSFAWTSNPRLVPFYRNVSGLAARYLELSKRLPDTSSDLWTGQALAILSRQRPGDEQFCMSVIEEVLKGITSEWAVERGIDVPQPIWQNGGLAILLPFFRFIVQPQAGVNTGPLHPTVDSIKATSTLRLPFPSSESKGLPLYHDWTMGAMDHLLRSADSPVFKSLPETWNASEVDVTRASLFFSKISQEVLRKGGLESFAMSAEETCFSCMKIFMLEHGQPQSDSTEEVYRDPIVERYMKSLLQPYTNGSDAPLLHGPDNLEKVATRFLGSEVPFFQFYTDFVALYDAVSFSHPIFARLLLPPTSMKYPIDYRKHLWCDFNHVLKTVRVQPQDLFVKDVRDYLYPVESDPQLLGSYLGSLLKGFLAESLRLIALHHIACCIWSDLQPEKVKVQQERASKMLLAIVGQGSPELVKEIVLYQQRETGSALLPPNCFEGVVKSRLDDALRLGGPVVRDRLAPLFS
ncbi:hypothetical protein CVT24_004447 [Panaeolus cyanescens]|uniref:RNA polymerase II-associated protein 1 C-terminal domain-containing protein n=1 Tax=Panaeolus cyanescens TaxID=181874 RepID=A0A409VEI8_9AGAR|nr:hypothetical protein CVT24_004447 [Panaeolus cyanescens]